jgi:hypothetical protein
VSKEECTHEGLKDKLRKYTDEGDDIRVCLLCGAPPAFNGVFLPKEDFQRRIGVPAGKSRIIVYAVCGLCHRLPEAERMRRIESEILKEYEVQ